VPELPDITVYVEALRRHLLGKRLLRVHLTKPFVLRSVEPPLAAVDGRIVTGITRLGKRVVISLDGDLHLVIHLMIAGRFRWLAAGRKPPGRIGLASFEFDEGTL
jgi:formamidopyrimidine-DNA glycosylase